MRRTSWQAVTTVIAKTSSTHFTLQLDRSLKADPTLMGKLFWEAMPFQIIFPEITPASNYIRKHPLSRFTQGVDDESLNYNFKFPAALKPSRDYSYANTLIFFGIARFIDTLRKENILGENEVKVIVEKDVSLDSEDALSYTAVRTSHSAVCTVMAKVSLTEFTLQFNSYQKVDTPLMGKLFFDAMPFVRGTSPIVTTATHRAPIPQVSLPAAPELSMPRPRTCHYCS